MRHDQMVIIERPETALDTLPVYQIRVKGRLDGERWAQWFDGMTVMVERGETVITGAVTDQAALYGILSRLRDLALPLLSVEKIGGNGEGTPPHYAGKRRFSGKINWLLVVLYLLLGGALSSLTVYFTSEAILDTALALTVLFAALCGIAAAFWRMDRGWGWRLLAWINGLAAGITCMVYLMAAGWLPVALGMALILFALAGWILYSVYRRPAAQAARSAEPIRWEPLGSRLSDGKHERAAGEPRKPKDAAR